MPSLSIELPNLQQTGPLIEILIGLSHPVLETAKKAGEPIPELRRCNAMIDTGASSTVIKTWFIGFSELISRFQWETQ